MVFKDSQGNRILTGDLPEAFRAEASTEIVQYPVNQQLKVYLRAEKGGCRIGYYTGETYYYEKRKLHDPFGFRRQQGPQNDSGFWYAVPQSLQTDLDSAASSILGRQVKAKAYYDLSDTLK